MTYGSVIEAINAGAQAVLEVLRTSGDVEYHGTSGVVSARRMFDQYRGEARLFEVEAMVMYNEVGRELVQWPQKE